MQSIHKTDPDCEFCKIVANEIPATIIYETSNVVAFLPLHPATIGHTLVVPKDHSSDFFELSPGAAGILGRECTHIAKALNVALRPEGMNLISSSGSAATQTILHVHYHLVPRWSSDAMDITWPSESSSPPKSATAAAAAALKEVLAQLEWSD